MWIKEACAAHSDLNTFYCAISLMENGHIYDSRSHRSAQKIIDICKAEAAKCLERFDEAVAVIESRAVRVTVREE